MSYHRRNGMGDGPITDPSQVDDTIYGGEVPPTRVSCDALPADSPWRKPGQACATPSSPLDYITGIVDGIFNRTPLPPTSATPGTPAAAATSPSLLLLAAAGGIAYYLLRKKTRA